MFVVGDIIQTILDAFFWNTLYLKNDDEPKKENNIKNWDDQKKEDNLKIKTTLKKKIAIGLH